jgi:hypothetical protein
MRICITLIAILFVAQGFSQDLLFKTDSTKLEVKILEINPTEIKYKLFNYEDGPTITILKNEVALIIYKNGIHEVMKTTSETPIIKEQKPIKNVKLEKWELQRKRETDRKKQEAERITEQHAEDSLAFARAENVLKPKNLIALNLFEPLNGCIGIAYLREFAKHKMILYLPINIGITAPFANNLMAPNIINNKYHDVKDYVYSRKIIEVGLGVNFQIFRKKSTTYFFGPLVDFGQYVGSFSGYQYGYIRPLNHYDFIMKRWSFMINNGFLFRPSKNLNIIVNAAIGERTDAYLQNDPVHYNDSKDYSMVLALKLGLTIGYKF